MMTLTLTPEQERRIKTIAARKKKPVEAVLDDLLAQESTERDTAEYVAQRRAAQREKNKPLLELLAQWREEEAAMTDEEKDIATEQVNTFLANLQANRVRIGDEPLQ